MKHELLKGEFILFEFESYEEFAAGSGHDILRFYGCTLNVPVGNFKVGDIIPIIAINFVVKGTLQVFDKEEMLLSEHDYTEIGYDLEGKKIISVSSDSNIRELLQTNVRST